MGKGSFSLKKDRMSRLLGLLRSGDFWTSGQLCEELSVSPRTLMRDLAELKESGYPIESDRGRGGGISLTERWGIDKLSLSNREAISLLLSLAIVETAMPIGKELKTKSLKQKIANTFPDPQRKTIMELRKRILIGSPASSHVLSGFHKTSEKITDTLMMAFFDSKRISIKYINEKNEATQREIDPQFLMINLPIWYLLGWDYLRSDIRVFRFDRIKEVEILNRPMMFRESSQFLRAFESYFSQL